MRAGMHVCMYVRRFVLGVRAGKHSLSLKLIYAASVTFIFQISVSHESQ